MELLGPNVLVLENTQGHPPLEVALHRARFDIVRYIHSRLPSNDIESIRSSRLHLAVALSDFDGVRQQLRHGASPNDIEHYTAQTALHRACLVGHLSTVRLLMSMNADR